MELENMAQPSFILNQLKQNQQPVSKSQKLELDIKQSNRFSLPSSNQNIKAQNSYIYCIRYLSMSKRFKIEHLKDSNFVEAIQNIQNLNGRVKVMGTIFKIMKLKPYYFQQYTEIKIADSIQNEEICYLEDKSGRIKLEFTNCQLNLPNNTSKTIKVEDLITGIVVMIEGQIVGNNIVNVQCINLPDFIDPPIYKPLNQTTYVCLMSGLNYDLENNTTKLRHLIQYLQGNLYFGYGNEVSSNISLIIIAGNLYGKQRDAKSCLTGSIKQLQDFKQLYNQLQENIKGVDELLNELANIIPVAIMPGQNEPVSQMFPQSPLQRAHFGESFENNTKIKFLTNPSEFNLGNIHFVGTSGQNIQDIKKQQNIKDQQDIDLIEMNLFYGHLAPTLHDTLIQQQQFTNDPFIIEQLPNIYFVGNMKKFGTKRLSNNLRIISIPQFSESGIICLVNLSTFECFSFEIQ
ncbi:unnamed protein product [Paramecium pentaurelia]|uniref:DNA polymerase delta small subunit n=1 Tax=Paramecium pentaurelia TaxID=43138 RepID=A0A8S1WT00_9CILI|nr:unnamed protein product [Paramecium pentaurelia]